MSLRDKYTEEEWDDLESKIPDKSQKKSEYQKVFIASDDDGHEYVIPYELKDKFYKLNLQEDWEAFDESFGKYICGGDPFAEYEFYIKNNAIR